MLCQGDHGREETLRGAGALSFACSELPLAADPRAYHVIFPKCQVIETRKKEAPYMLPEDVFVERPR